MRITLVTETFPPEVNGVARTLSELVAGLAGRSHRVEVIRPRQGPADRPLPGGCCDEHLVPGLPLPFYRGLHFGLPVWARLRRRWCTERPDVVHVATEGPLGWAALTTARRLGLPVTSSFHTNFHLYGDYYHYGGLRRTALRYLRWFHNRAACTLVPTPDVAAVLGAAGFHDVDVIGRGVDLARFSPEHRSETLRHSWGAEPGEVVCAYVGRLAEEKNIALVARGLEVVGRRHPRVRCVAVGDGPAARWLRERHPELIFCGMRHGEDLARHYASADLLLFPSQTETFGNVVLEGMASGLAVLAFDDAAARLHIVHGHNGLKVATGDEAGFLAEAVRAAGSLDDCRRLGAAARQTALGLSWDGVVARLEGFLTSALVARPEADVPVRSPQKNGAPARL